MTSIIPVNPSNPDYPDQSICDLGIGMTEMGRWTPLEPFNNYMFELDEWAERRSDNNRFTCYQPLYNLSGHVGALRPNTYLVCYPFGGKASGVDGRYYPTGTWVMEFEGSGMMEFGTDIGFLFQKVISGTGVKQVTALVTNTTQGGWSWNLKATDPNNPLIPKAIYLSGTDKLALTNKFRNTWKWAKAIRFMDWAYLNTCQWTTLSANRALKVQNADKAFADQLTPGLVFRGTTSNASGAVCSLDFRHTFLPGEVQTGPGYQEGPWAPSAYNGIWINYRPFTSAQFTYNEPIDFGFSTVRMCKMVSSWGLAVSAAVNGGQGEVTVPPVGGFTEGYNPMPGWGDPQMNWWQGEALGDYLKYPLNSDLRNVPVAKMIQICNELLADMWICVPRLLDLESCSALATYINNNLANGLKFYVEYCNEPWNQAFQDFRHFMLKGHKFTSPSLGQTAGDSGRRMYAYDAYAHLRPFKQIMSGTRVVECLLNVQSTDVGFASIALDWSGLPANYKSVVDGVSIAPYFANKGLRDQWNTRFLDEFAPLGLTGHPDHILNLTSGQILDRMEFTCVPNSMDTIRQTLADMTPRGYKVAVYECGHHLDNGGFYNPFGFDTSSAFAQAYIAKMYAVHEAQQMGRIYFYYFAQMGRLLNYRVPAMHYNAMTRFDNGTFWGLLRSYDRPNVKYQAWLLAILQCGTSANGPSGGSGATSKETIARRNRPTGLKRMGLKRR